MQHYLQNLLVVVSVGAVLGYIFAPQIDTVKHALIRWDMRRKRRKLNNL